MGEAERNYIGGNNGTAISINHSNNVTVGGNVIGLLADGSTIAKNIGDGVLVAGSSNNVTIGWSSEYSTTGNIISGNTGNGIHIIDAADTIKISGNEIGLKDNGTTSAGNLQDGINISGNVTNVIIGDQSAAAVNVISANGGSGVYLSGDNLFNINLENNLIGLDSSGSTTLGNAQYGIWVDLPVGIDAGISIGTPGGFGNIISGNLLGQINITGGSSTEIVGNFIGTDGSRSEVLSGGSDSFGIRVTGSSSLNAIGTFSL